MIHVGEAMLSFFLLVWSNCNCHALNICQTKRNLHSLIEGERIIENPKKSLEARIATRADQREKKEDATKYSKVEFNLFLIQYYATELVIVSFFWVSKASAGCFHFQSILIFSLFQVLRCVCWLLLVYGFLRHTECVVRFRCLVHCLYICRRLCIF